MVAPIWKAILLTLRNFFGPEVLKDFGNMLSKVLQNFGKRGRVSLYRSLGKKKLHKKVLTNVENKNAALSPASPPS